MAGTNALRELDPLLGDWVMESKKLGGRGRTTVDRSEKDMFVRLRSSSMEGQFPSSTWIIGADDSSEDCTCLYRDSRDVTRVYQMAVSDGIWKIWRNAPGFNQRYIGDIAPDGNSIEGRWEFSEDGSTWEVDFDVGYRRAEPGDFPQAAA